MNAFGRYSTTKALWNILKRPSMSGFRGLGATGLALSNDAMLGLALGAVGAHGVDRDEQHGLVGIARQVESAALLHEPPAAGDCSHDHHEEANERKTLHFAPNFVRAIVVIAADLSGWPSTRHNSAAAA